MVTICLNLDKSKMKKSQNILDYFKVQSIKIPCPACGILLVKCNLNSHLDSNCSSSLSANKKSRNSSSETKCKMLWNSAEPNDKNFPKLAKPNSKISRLSLKHQKSLKLSNSNSQIVKRDQKSRVITLGDDLSSSGSVCKNEQREDQKKIMQCEELIILDDDSSSSSNFIKTEQKKEQKSIRENKKVLVSLDDDSSSFSNSLDDDDSSSFGNVNETVKEEGQERTLENRVLIALDDNAASSGSSNIVKMSESVCTQISETNVFPIGNTENSTISAFLTQQDSFIISKQSDAVNDLNHEKVSMPSKNLPVPSSVKNAKEINSVKNIEMDVDVAAVLNDAEESLEADNDVFTENNHPSGKYIPYYIANFRHILDTVICDEYNKNLFNEEDMIFVNAFKTSSDPAQKLYVRLFQRKYKWLRMNKINYPDITKDPEMILNELVRIGLVDYGLDKIDLETALDLLSLPEARIVVKQFNFNSSGKSKADMTHMLLKHCKEHKSVFFTSTKNNISSLMLKKVKQVLGSCYRISLLPKRLFTRILMLFSLPTISEDDDDAAGGQQQQLLTLLFVNKGEITFPNYKINRQTIIFNERDELIRYEEAIQLENDIMNAIESKNFDLAKELYIEAKEEFEDQLTSSFVGRAASLPSYLKKYTSFHVYVRCMTQGVEILQRLRQYKEAVELLKRLLDQKVFCQDYRGRWWDRMALNLEQHLKQRQHALEALQQGIEDKNVRVGHRFSLLTRALRILKTVDEMDALKNEILEAANVIEAPKVLIKGRLFPKNIHGRRHIFISSSSTVTDEDDIMVLCVEELAIEHYKNEGFSEGIHGESSTFHSLYGLLFWDIIYDGDIPDAFISPYQNHPLDLNHESFFIRREKQIINHLEDLRKSTLEEVKEIVKSAWEAHFGQSSLVIWDRFRDVDHILGLVSCMGNNLLCGICERLARDFRFTRSGVPDLVVWNPDTLQVKIVEVKGPGDKLSSKQILWLDYLLKLGAQAEVCHVEAVGSKKLRKE